MAVDDGGERMGTKGRDGAHVDDDTSPADRGGPEAHQAEPGAGSDQPDVDDLDPDVTHEDHQPARDDVEEADPEPYVIEASLAELSDGEGGIAAPPQAAAPRETTAATKNGDDVMVGRGLDQRVPAWLDTAVEYTWRALIMIVGAAVILYVLTRLYLVTLPIILALILATLCVPPARGLESKGVPRALAALIVVIGGIGSLIGVIALLAPMFITQMQELQPTVAEGIDSVLVWLEEGPIGYDRTELEQLFNEAMESLEGAAGTIATQVGSIAVAIFEGLAALILALVLLFFFVKDGDQIVRWFITRMPEHHRDTFRAAGARGWVALSGFVRGTAAVALIDAVGIGVGLALVGVPLVLPLSVLVFFGGFIPVIGATVTGLLAVLVALASGGITDAVIVGAIVLLVQQVESNVLQPTIMRRAVALHPVVILGVLTGGAVLIGIVGAFLAVPVAAVVAAVGNELRLRHEIGQQGGVAGPGPVGGPGVDPTTVRVQFPEDTQLRAAAQRRRGGSRSGERDEKRPRRRRRRSRQRVDGNGSPVQPVEDAPSMSDEGPRPTSFPVREDGTRPPAADHGPRPGHTADTDPRSPGTEAAATDTDR